MFAKKGRILRVIVSAENVMALLIRDGMQGEEIVEIGPPELVMIGRRSVITYVNILKIAGS